MLRLRLVLRKVRILAFTIYDPILVRVRGLLLFAIYGHRPVWVCRTCMSRFVHYVPIQGPHHPV